VFYAHSIPGEPEVRWEPLEDHLCATGGLAAAFAARFGFSAAGEAAGRLHDVGKYSDAFQRRIRNDGGRTDHSTAGACEAFRLFGPIAGSLLAYGIAGHHAGLADGGRATDADLTVRLGKALDPGWERWRSRNAIQPPERARVVADVSALLDSAAPDDRPYAAGFLGRMLFSALVDADFLATEAFLDTRRGAARGGHPAVGNLAIALNAHLEEKAAEAERTALNTERARILADCRAAADLAPGVFTLQVPTGAGKTLSSLAFALDHAVGHGLDRVVYAVPFTTITEQTADVFRQAFASVGDDCVVEHHGAADLGASGDREEPVGPARMILATENWDAPVIVTTTVQLFQSLHAARPRTCRKLHNLARAVIVLDEAQALPITALAPCLAALRELVLRYGSTVLLMSATLPVLDAPDTPLLVSLPKARAIIDLPPARAAVFRRVRSERLGVLDDAAVVERLAGERQGLVVVDTRRHAAELFDSLPPEGRFHLSAGMTPAHRRAVLEEVKRRLATDRPCRLVATRVIEAGVDVSFPIVMRAIAGVDSLAQAAGRCNRDGELGPDGGRFLVFEPADSGKALPGVLVDLRRRADLGRETLEGHPDPLDPAAVAVFFRKLQVAAGDRQDDRDCFRRLSTPSMEIVRGIVGLAPDDGMLVDIPYRSVAEAFQMFEAAGEDLIVPFDRPDGPGEELIDELRAALSVPASGVPRPSLSLLRKLRAHTVQDYRTDALLAAGRALAIDGDRRYLELTDRTAYHPETGLRPSSGGPSGGLQSGFGIMI